MTYALVFPVLIFSMTPNPMSACNMNTPSPLLSLFSFYFNSLDSMMPDSKPTIHEQDSFFSLSWQDPFNRCSMNCALFFPTLICSMTQIPCRPATLIPLPPSFLFFLFTSAVSITWCLISNRRFTTILRFFLCRGKIHFIVAQCFVFQFFFILLFSMFQNSMSFCNIKMPSFFSYSALFFLQQSR